MEVKKSVRIISRNNETETISFKLKDNRECEYLIDNCRRVKTLPKRICYSGNLFLSREGIELEKNALLWDQLNNTGVLVYQE